MKTTLKFLAALTLLLVAFNPYPAAPATTSFKYQGKGASAYFFSMDSSGCIRTTMWLLGAEEVQQAVPGDRDKATSIILTLYQYNDCTATRLAQASGYAVLTRDEFRVSGNLQSARLVAVVPMEDWYSGRTFDAAVDLTWHSTSDVYHQIFHYKYSFEDCFENIRSKEDFRYAQATGAILDGSTNLVPEPSYQASIFSAKDGEVSHGCQ